MKNLRIGIWGFGAMGSGMARLLARKQGVEIVGVCDVSPERAERSVFDVLQQERLKHPDVKIRPTPEEAFQGKEIDVLLLATDSTTRGAFDKIAFGLRNGMNVISTAEEMAFPQAQEPDLASEIDRIANEQGRSVLGTGINPGFVLDYLVLALTGTCEHVESITALRVNDLSPFGPTVMHEQGVGLSKREFLDGVNEGKIVGHVGFPESIGMIAQGLGWTLEGIDETREPIIAANPRRTDLVDVRPGYVAGCRQQGKGYVNGSAKIVMDHPQQVLPGEDGVATADCIEVKGTPSISMTISPEISGGIGTIAMCVNMIPHIVNARPGLRTMLDLPVPRAIMGDFRDQIWPENETKPSGNEHA